MGLRIAAAAACVLTGVSAGAETGAPIIDVEKSADRRIAIGIGSYPELGSIPPSSTPREVLAFDFALSVWFAPVVPEEPPSAMIPDWSRAGAEVFVEFAALAGDVVGRVRDASSGALLFERAGFVSGEVTRQDLHAFADDAVTALTGEPGMAGTQILCEWDPADGKGKRIVRMDADGHGMQEVTGEEALELSPRWAPDGGRCAYTSYSSGWPDVWIQDLDTGSRERVAHFEGLNAQGDFSPDGGRLVLTISRDGNPEIHGMDLETGKVHRLTRHRATDNSPVWSPDGGRIAFVSDRSGGPQVYVLDLETREVRRVTFRGSYNTSPDWSPDGRKIAYSSFRSGGFEVRVVDLATRRVETVASGGDCEDPSWSPDGRSLLYSRSAGRVGERTELVITHLKERRTIRISRGVGRFLAPDWSPLLRRTEEEGR
ncbi:MAG: hypothetical protein CME07_01150 [Gemmatimonadetes bacterium]|jgi:TolB protein|nr:hypothetical protein [Gemmatimonadota bacterium]